MARKTAAPTRQRRIELGSPCVACGSCERRPRRRGGREGDCVPCSNRRARGRLQKSHLSLANWKRTGWISREECRRGRAIAKAATECEGCHSKDPGSSSPNKQGFCADHSHLEDGGTGRFRGVLCVSCNMAIGLFEKRAWTLLPAELRDYLARPAIRPVLRELFSKPPPRQVELALRPSNPAIERRLLKAAILRSVNAPG
jgi:hypothetical protein